MSTSEEIAAAAAAAAASNVSNPSRFSSWMPKDRGMTTAMRASMGNVKADTHFGWLMASMIFLVLLVIAIVVLLSVDVSDNKGTFFNRGGKKNGKHKGKHHKGKFDGGSYAFDGMGNIIGPNRGMASISTPNWGQGGVTALRNTQTSDNVIGPSSIQLNANPALSSIYQLSPPFQTGANIPGESLNPMKYTSPGSASSYNPFGSGGLDSEAFGEWSFFDGINGPQESGPPPALFSQLVNQKMGGGSGGPPQMMGGGGPPQMMGGGGPPHMMGGGGPPQMMGGGRGGGPSMGGRGGGPPMGGRGGGPPMGGRGGGR